MDSNIQWHEIALRLLWTVIGGTLIGINREEHGQGAGLRTTLLVTLAASLSMIQVNLLLHVAGKAPDSFVVLDLMRLPLGILSGMGFIGAGAILRRDNLVMGVTTAATLWFVTVMGLCFGGGQIILGVIALVLGWIVLTGLKWIEKKWKQDRHATLIIGSGQEDLTEDEIARTFAAAGYQIYFTSVTYGEGAFLRDVICHVRWRGHANDTCPAALLKEFSNRFHLQKIEWRARGS